MGTPDFNPDKENWTGHSWIVQPATRRPIKGVEIDGKLLPFGREGTLRLRDGAVANAVRQKYNKDLVVTRMRRPDVHDRGHNYFFGQMPALPFAKYDELGRRIRDGETKGEESTEGATQDAFGKNDERLGNAEAG